MKKKERVTERQPDESRGQRRQGGWHLCTKKLEEALGSCKPRMTGGPGFVKPTRRRTAAGRQRSAGEFVGHRQSARAAVPKLGQETREKASYEGVMSGSGRWEAKGERRVTAT